MTVSSIVPVNTYTGNSTVKKFDFDFLIESENELIVEHISEDNVITKLILGVDYSINEIGNQNGSYIIFPLETSSYNILKENEKITLMLTLTIKQESEFKNSSYFNLNILEWTFDYIVRILQILNRKVERSIKVNEGSDILPDELVKNLFNAEANAKISETNAKQSETNARASETATAQLKNETNQIKQDTQNIADNALQNISTAKTDAVNTIATDRSDAASAISLSKTDALSGISNAKTSAIKEINTTKTAAISSVNSTKDSANASVNATKDQAVQDVQTEGSRQNAQMQDYVELAKDWANKIDGTVDGTEYSAKYYAEKSKSHSAVTYKQLMASPGYARGEVSDDTEGYQNVLSYAHSTFDLSKFTVFGSPTISEDGILTPTSLNYVYFTGLNLYNASSWKIKGSFIAAQGDNTVDVIFSAADNINGFGIQFYVNIQGYYIFQGSSNSTSWLWTNSINSSNFQNNTKYYYVIEFTGTKYNLNISTDDIEYTTISSYTTSDKISALTSTMTYNIGSSKDADRAWGKPIDLKDYAVWSDVQPVFSGNKTGTDINNEIEIPYTLSNNGSKIVDVAYRDRVQALYEQTGEAMYYTIDEQNQNFTLPAGEVYGMISNTRDFSLNKTQITNCILEAPNGVATYSGSTITIKSGLKALMPNGKNADGTLNNIEYTLKTDRTLTHISLPTGQLYLFLVSSDNIADEILTAFVSEIKLQNETPPEVDYTMWYSPSTNIWKRYFTSTGWVTYNACIVAIHTANNGIITSLTPYQPFRAIDYNYYLYNGISNVICTTAPTTASTASAQRPAVVIENYLNGTSWYRVWSDGWIEQGGDFTAGGSSTGSQLIFLKAFTTTTYKVLANPLTSTSEQNCILNKTTTSCYINSQGHGGGAFYTNTLVNWYACGY